ncbi:flagellar protein FlaG [Desulfofundulus thermocisternus]|uniref:flagellar protein FlaG n=1 Tax=Desulfofundulus thermocisternus TaxID=42471 RepID=UPI00217E36E6|nr:flagellar protein FlaG [Desulfofundulus thermocisternus]
MGVAAVEGKKALELMSDGTFLKSGQTGGDTEQLPAAPEKAQEDRFLTPALEKLSETARIYDYRFHFKIHEATGRIMVQVIDQETGEVLNEIPPEKILDLVAHIQELMGLLVDERV